MKVFTINYLYHNTIPHNMDKEGKRKDKVKVSLDRELVNNLKSRLTVGTTYSDLIRELLREYDENR